MQKDLCRTRLERWAVLPFNMLSLYIIRNNHLKLKGISGTIGVHFYFLWIVFSITRIKWCHIFHHVLLMQQLSWGCLKELGVEDNRHQCLFALYFMNVSEKT
jgi:hypothetical protein